MKDTVQGSLEDETSKAGDMQMMCVHHSTSCRSYAAVVGLAIIAVCRLQMRMLVKHLAASPWYPSKQG
jgi:hypothetical protein